MIHNRALIGPEYRTFASDLTLVNIESEMLNLRRTHSVWFCFGVCVYKVWGLGFQPRLVWQKIIGFYQFLLHAVVDPDGGTACLIFQSADQKRSILVLSKLQST